MMLPIEVEIDRRDLGGGVKNWDWIKKGVPLRVEIGPRDLEKNSVTVSRRDQPVKNKGVVPMDEFVARAPEILGSIQGFAVCACERVPGCEHPRDRFEEGFLRFLHREKLLETRDPWRFCACALERVTRNRGAN